MPDVFISYSRKDSEKAEQLIELLASAGLSVWIDRQGIDLATSWSGEIVHAIEECRVFAVLLSVSSVASKNVGREVALASEKNKKILPLELEPVELSRDMQYHLAGIQRSPMTNIDAIIRALGKLGLEATGAPVAPKIVKSSDGRKSLMILPFEDFSPTGDNGWFTDGMASELINSLSLIKELRVIDWNTSKLFKDRKVKTVELARELEVRYFLQGQVRKFGDQIKISITLLDIETNDHLWQDALKGTMEDVFDIQEQVSIRVLDGLKLHLSSDEKSKLAHHGTNNTEAYELFLKSNEYYAKNTQIGLRTALRQVTAALQLDPNYPDALTNKTLYLTELYRLFDRNPEYLVEGERLARRLLDVEPEFTLTYSRLASIYQVQGRLAEAEQAAKTFVQLSPGNYYSHYYLGFFYVEVNQPERAVPHLERSLAIKPEFLLGYWSIVLTCNRLHDPQRAERWAAQSLSYYEKHLRLMPDDQNMRLAYSTMLDAAGQRERAVEAMEELVKKQDLDGVTLYNLGSTYARWGEDRKALSLLQRSVASGFCNRETFLFDTDLDSLRELPEFHKLLAQVDAKIGSTQGERGN